MPCQTPQKKTTSVRPCMSHQVNETHTADQEDRSDNETPAKAFEERAVAIGPNHPRQVVARRTKAPTKM